LTGRGKVRPTFKVFLRLQNVFIISNRKSVRDGPFRLGGSDHQAVYNNPGPIGSGSIASIFTLATATM
jgi:hypothetical protein